MIELHNSNREKIIAERKRSDIKGSASPAREAQQDALFQPEAGSPVAFVLGGSSGAAPQKRWAGTSHQHKGGRAGTGPAWSSHAISLRS